MPVVLILIQAASMQIEFSRCRWVICLLIWTTSNVSIVSVSMRRYKFRYYLKTNLIWTIDEITLLFYIVRLDIINSVLYSRENEFLKHHIRLKCRRMIVNLNCKYILDVSSKSLSKRLAVEAEFHILISILRIARVIDYLRGMASYLSALFVCNLGNSYSCSSAFSSN